MKHLILPTTIALGVTIGSLIHPTQPEYLHVNKVTKVVEKQPEKVIPEAKAYEPDIESMINFIHGQESSYGRNQTPGALHLYCRNRGLWNELGYGGMRRKICFANEQEGRAKVAEWLKRHLERTGSVAKTLCYYNLGKEEINCKYYQKYIGAL